MKEVIELSWQTQVILVGGCLAYTLAFSGRRADHKATDSILIILCFGSAGLLAIHLMSETFERFGFFEDSMFREIVLALFGIAIPIIFAIFWRRKLREKVKVLIRKISESEDDGLPTAWNTIIQSQGLNYSQLNITLKNGRILESYPLEDFNDDPDGPCVLGGDGSIGLYVTHIENSEGNRRQAKNIRDSNGVRMTYVPADQIAEIDFRREIKKKKRSG